MTRPPRRTDSAATQPGPEACPADPVAALLDCAHPDPHAVLGAFARPGGTLVRTLRPGASAVSVRTADALHPLLPVPAAGPRPAVFAGLVPIRPGDDYRLVVTYPPGRSVVAVDGYRMPPTVSADDLRRLAAGTHTRLWEVLGARPMMMGTPTGAVAGTAFSVWAPHARGVAVIGGFDGWSPIGTPMRRLGGSGVWEVFVPGADPGDMYKFRIRGADGAMSDRADPMARWTQTPPDTASKIAPGGYRWRDSGWTGRRRAGDARRRPVSVYEVHPGSWRPGLDYAGLAAELVPYVSRMGFTHVELMPVTEHPYGASWGYQATSYFAPSARFGPPDGLRALVDAFHRAGIGVIADWVPAHFPRDGWALARFDGAALYEPSDPLRADHPDWGTLTFDLSRPQVRAFLLSSALYWLEEFHLDGLRVDAVASLLFLDYSRGPGRWRPNPRGGREDLAAVAFLRSLTATVARRHPGALLIAEDSSLRAGTTAPARAGGLGFTFQWNLGWTHDTLRVLSTPPPERAAAGPPLARPLSYAHTESHVLALSHDEVVHGKGTPWQRTHGDGDERAADVRALLAAMWAFPGKKLLFMGQEYGQSTEWSDVWGPDWGQLRDPHHRRIHRLVSALNRLYAGLPALWCADDDPGATRRIDLGGGPGAAAFLRTAPGAAPVLCVVNLTCAPVALPAGRWTVLLDTGAPDDLPGPVPRVPAPGSVAEPRSTVWLTPRSGPGAGGDR